MTKAITIRGVDDRVHDALRRRAARTGRSVEAEVRTILAEACLPGGAADWAAGLRLRARARTAGQPQTDSAELIREDRDGR
jgi:plasmid stability protein